ncbi:hypothetical protein B296_00025283, partial [Ensete ventricosum]
GDEDDGDDDEELILRTRQEREEKEEGVRISLPLDRSHKRARALLLAPPDLQRVKVKIPDSDPLLIKPFGCGLRKCYKGSGVFATFLAVASFTALAPTSPNPRASSSSSEEVRLSLPLPLGIAMDATDVSENSDITAFISLASYDQWFSLRPSGWCPPSRYKVKWDKGLLVVAGHTKELSDNVTEWGNNDIARGGQSATLVGSKLFLFGGEDRKRQLLNDLHILDLTTMTWDEIEIKYAFQLIPLTGATETITLNISKFVWSMATSVGSRAPLASEVFVLKIKPNEPVRPRLLQSPAAAAAAASVTAAYAIIAATDEKNNSSKNTDDSNSKSNHESAQNDTDSLIAEKKILKSRIVEVRDENSRIQARIDELNISHTELLKVNFLSRHSLENELEVLRRQKSEMEQETVDAQKQISGGVWQWLSGTTQNSEQ